MTRTTFSFWTQFCRTGLPLVVNQGLPSEARLLARGDNVHIYIRTRIPPIRANRPRTDSGNISTPKQNTMAKKATSTPAPFPAKKGGKKPAPAPAKPATKKGYAK
jgi:hypothetical protein